MAEKKKRKSKIKQAAKAKAVKARARGEVAEGKVGVSHQVALTNQQIWMKMKTWQHHYLTVTAAAAAAAAARTRAVAWPELLAAKAACRSDTTLASLRFDCRLLLDANSSFLNIIRYHGLFFSTDGVADLSVAVFQLGIRLEYLELYGSLTYFASPWDIRACARM